MSAGQAVGFNKKVIEEYIKHVWAREDQELRRQAARKSGVSAGAGDQDKVGPARINSDGVALVCQSLACLVEEACIRAGEEARVDRSKFVEPSHIEQVLPQLLLDF